MAAEFGPSTASVSSKEKMPSLSSPCSPSPEDPSTSVAIHKNSSDGRCRTVSPPSREKCPICLGIPVDESKTESCQHRFCFVCLVEWSKIKTQCPMCKAPFKKIIHNTKFDENGETCETFDVPEPAPPEPVPRRFRNQTAMGRERSELLRQIRELQTRLTIIDNARRAQDPLEQMRHNYQIGRFGGRSRGFGALFDYHRTRDAMIAARAEQGRRAVNDSLRRYQQLYDDSENATREELIGNPEFRRLIYERGLRVLPMDTDGRVRDCSPRFLRNNEALRNRLIAWLTRELSILLHNAQRVSSVAALIIELLQRYDMNREEFQSRIRPLVPHFEHFLHEFVSFAQSPYDLPEYDRRCEYQRRGTSPVPIEPGERQVDANDSDIQVVAESARLREAVQRQAEAVRRQTEAADRSTAAIHAAMANITAQITQLRQNPLTAWMQPSINMGLRIDDSIRRVAYDNSVVQFYDSANAAPAPTPNQRSRDEEDYGYGGDVQLVSSRSSTVAAGEGNEEREGQRQIGQIGRRRSMIFEDEDEDVDDGPADDDDDIQLLNPPPVRHVASAPNLRQQLEAIMNGDAGAVRSTSDRPQREISLIDISSPPPSLASESTAPAEILRVRSESPRPGTSGGYRASWATRNGRAPEAEGSANSTRPQGQATYAHFDSDTSTPSPPQFRNTFRLVDDVDDDVIVESTSSGTTFGIVDSPSSTPSSSGAVDISDLSHIRRIEREVEDAIESGRRLLEVEREEEVEDTAIYPEILPEQPSVQQGSSTWSDDSDVEVVAELKPKHLRTPPLVELLDDMDDDLPANQDIPMQGPQVKQEKEDVNMPSTSTAGSSQSRKRRRSHSRTRSSRSRDHDDGERHRSKKHHKKHKKHHKSSSSHSKSKKRRHDDKSADDSDDSDRRRRRSRKRRRADTPIPSDSSASSDGE